MVCNFMARENSKFKIQNSKLLIVSIILFCAINLFAQSGRVKPAETPIPRPKIFDAPNAATDPITPKSTPTPTPTPATVAKKTEDEVIEVSSILIPIPASVLDAQGRTIGNLKLEDFDLQIDGKSAEISEISRSQSPVRLALLFDNSSSVIQARDFEKKAAVRFFKQVIRPDKDLAALYSVATVAQLEQPLTKNVSQLVDAIENFAKPEGATALLDGIVQAANYLKDYQGRRVIVIVSDGEDTLSDSTLEDAVKTVQVMNCQVYIVKTTEFENLKRTGNRVGNANIRALTAERRMQEIAGQTGGAVYSPIDEDELENAFNRISAELSEQYILSYYPDSNSERGKFQSITVSVKNKKDVSVRTRKGYYIPKK